MAEATTVEQHPLDDNPWLLGRSHVRAQMHELLGDLAEEAISLAQPSSGPWWEATLRSDGYHDVFIAQPAENDVPLTMERRRVGLRFLSDLAKIILPLYEAAPLVRQELPHAMAFLRQDTSGHQSWRTRYWDPFAVNTEVLPPDRIRRNRSITNLSLTLCAHDFFMSGGLGTVCDGSEVSRFERQII